MEPSPGRTPVQIQNLLYYFLRSAAVYQNLLQVPNQSSDAAFFDAATVQQQPRFKLFPVTRHESSSRSCVSSKDLIASSTKYEHRARFNCSFCAFDVPSATVYTSLRSRSSVRYHSHRATAAAFQGRHSLCGSHERCFCACFCAILSRNLDDCNPHFL